MFCPWPCIFVFKFISSTSPLGRADTVTALLWSSWMPLSRESLLWASVDFSFSEPTAAGHSLENSPQNPRAPGSWRCLGTYSPLNGAPSKWLTVREAQELSCLALGGDRLSGMIYTPRAPQGSGWGWGFTWNRKLAWLFALHCPTSPVRLLFLQGAFLK